VFPSDAWLNGSSYQRVLKGCPLYWLPVLRLSSSPLCRLSPPMTTQIIHSLNLFQLHKEAQTRTQGRALLIDTFLGTLLALFRPDSCLPHPRGQLCQDTPFMSICPSHACWWDSQSRGSVIVSCMRESVLLFHFGRIWYSHLITQIPIWCSIVETDLQASSLFPYLHFTDLNTPDYLISVAYLHIIQN